MAGRQRTRLHEQRHCFPTPKGIIAGGAATEGRDHFLRVARRETARTGVRVPLHVSHSGLLQREGPPGRAWRTPGGGDAARAFPER